MVFSGEINEVQPRFLPCELVIRVPLSPIRLFP